MKQAHPPHKGPISSDDVSVSLDALEADPDGAIFSFPLLGPVVVLAPPSPPVGSIRPGNVQPAGLIAPPSRCNVDVV
jgi:hypothetical protein